MKAVLIRNETGDEGTFGEIITDGGFCCRSLELPWRKNEKEKSCIPAGIYIFAMTDSPKHGRCYEAQNVKGRDHIQIHSANLAGDVEKGYVSQLLGCIAPGTVVATFGAGVYPAGIKPQRGVTASRTTLAQFEEVFKSEPFELTIQWKDRISPE